MLIVRKFELDSPIEYKKQIEKIFEEFGAVAARCYTEKCIQGDGQPGERVHFLDCGVSGKQFDALVDRLNELPMSVALIY